MPDNAQSCVWYQLKDDSISHLWFPDLSPWSHLTSLRACFKHSTRSPSQTLEYGAEDKDSARHKELIRLLVSHVWHIAPPLYLASSRRSFPKLMSEVEAWLYCLLLLAQLFAFHMSTGQSLTLELALVAALHGVTAPKVMASVYNQGERKEHRTLDSSWYKYDL